MRIVRGIVGVILLIADLFMIPMLVLYYILLSIDLLCGCKSTNGNFKDEFRDFNEIVRLSIEERIHDHKCRIIGV